MKRKQFYFYCRKCLKRKPVEEESRQRVGCCKPCFAKSYEIDAEFAPMVETHNSPRENNQAVNAPNSKEVPYA